MKNLGKEIIKLAKTNRMVCRELKLSAVRAQAYELGANIRQIEQDYHTNLEDFGEEYKSAHRAKSILAISELPVSASTAWKIHELMKLAAEDESAVDFSKVEDINKRSIEIFGQ